MTNRFPNRVHRTLPSRQPRNTLGVLTPSCAASSDGEMPRRAVNPRSTRRRSVSESLVIVTSTASSSVTIIIVILFWFALQRGNFVRIFSLTRMTHMTRNERNIGVDLAER